jgi:hypothetical protein
MNFGEKIKSKKNKKVIDDIPSVLDDPTKRPAIDAAVTAFREQMKNGWRVNRFDSASPLLSDELQEILAQGVYDLIDSMGRAEHPKTLERLKTYFKRADSKDYSGLAMIGDEKLSVNWVDIFTGAAAVLLEKKIANTEQVQNSPGDKSKITQHLLGASIRRAIDIAEAQEISFEGVGWKAFSDTPFRNK